MIRRAAVVNDMRRSSPYSDATMKPKDRERYLEESGRRAPS